jgi:hypothetical protein
MADMTNTGVLQCETGASTCCGDIELVGDPAGNRKQEIARYYNRKSFLFRHRLSGHPLFQLTSLIELARRHGDQPDFAYWSSGPVDVRDRWEKGADQRRPLLETIAGIAQNDSLVMLKHAEQDAVFGPALNDLLSRMVELAGHRMGEDVIVGRGTILIASPHRVTTYHMDADTNFLFQIAADKSFSVFDQTDNSLVTEDELERYHAGDANGAVFKPDRLNDAKTYDLRAGLGIHIPSTAPHWAQNGDGVSVALSLNYDLRSVQRRARIHAMNHKLRRLGIDPAPPGLSRWRDRVKLTAMAIGALRQLSRHAPAEPRPAG